MNEDRIARRSEELFQRGFYCAGSVLQAIAEDRRIKSDYIPGIATGFCGGVARTSHLCGAVSGGIMVIGLQHGRNSPEATFKAAYEAIRVFVMEFERRHGSSDYGQLLGCRLDTPEGQRFFKGNNLRTKCKVFTREAERMAANAIHAQSK